MSLVTKRLGKKTAVALGIGLRSSDRIRVEEPSAEAREAAWRLFTGQTDKDYDLIDCISFAVMEAHGVDTAFGFDRHFAEHGFRLLPEA